MKPCKDHSVEKRNGQREINEKQRSELRGSKLQRIGKRDETAAGESLAVGEKKSSVKINTKQT